MSINGTPTTSKPSGLPPWPPQLSSDHLSALTTLAADYALSHGLVYRPTATDSAPPSPSSTIHAPITLFPSPLPRPLFKLGKVLQPLYNALYARVTEDSEWLEGVMSGIAKADEFQGQLFKIWKTVLAEGVSQPLQLGLWRSDYLVHTLPDDTLTLHQVEFNTISSSFGALSQKMAELHRYLESSTGYFGASPLLQAENFPQNETIKGLASGLAEGHKAYGVPSACVAMVVQPHERNAFDQRWLEYELLETYHIHLHRVTLATLHASTTLSSSKALVLTTPLSPDPIELSVIYYRAGYAPTDYPTTVEWEARLKVERSKAIKCPTVAAQLAGAKKVQQALMEEGMLERFLLDPRRGKKHASADLALLRASFAPMYALTASTLPATISNAAHLVLKPQREGGGNNVYRSSIPPFLSSLPEAERDAWVVMELIEPPPLRNLLFKAGGAEGGKEGEVISELGMFGVCLFGGGGDARVNREVGWLVRTKARESDEGGVAAGYSCLDSVLLVD